MEVYFRCLVHLQHVLAFKLMAEKASSSSISSAKARTMAKSRRIVIGEVFVRIASLSCSRSLSNQDYARSPRFSATMNCCRTLVNGILSINERPRSFPELLQPLNHLLPGAGGTQALGHGEGGRLPNVSPYGQQVPMCSLRRHQSLGNSLPEYVRRVAACSSF